MYCPKCGKNIPDLSLICSYCGTPISNSQYTNTSQAKWYDPRYAQPNSNRGYWYDPRYAQLKVKKKSGKKIAGILVICLLVGYIWTAIIYQFSVGGKTPVAPDINSGGIITTTNVSDVSTSTNVVTDESSVVHLYLVDKNKGCCRTLTGDVQLVMVLTDEPNSSWSQKDIEAFRKVQEDTTAKMIKEASNYGAKLNIKIDYMRCSVSNELTLAGSSDWMKAAVKSASMPNEESIVSFLRNKYSTNETAVLFCLNRKGRSFASSSMSESNAAFEYGFLKTQGDGRLLQNSLKTALKMI